MFATGREHVRLDEAVQRRAAGRPRRDHVIQPVAGRAHAVDRAHGDDVGIVPRHGDRLRARTGVPRRRDHDDARVPRRFHRAIQRIDEVGRGRLRRSGSGSAPRTLGVALFCTTYWMPSITRAYVPSPFSSRTRTLRICFRAMPNVITGPIITELVPDDTGDVRAVAVRIGAVVDAGEAVIHVLCADEIARPFLSR